MVHELLVVLVCLDEMLDELLGGYMARGISGYDGGICLIEERVSQGITDGLALVRVVG